MQKIRTYTELLTYPTFEERFEYLALRGVVGMATFGFDRYINQWFYKSKPWKEVRNHVILRDRGCDLAIPGRDIFCSIRIHHMNPMTVEDIENNHPSILDPEFLICTSLQTHTAIHFGGASRGLIGLPIERRKGDTTLW